MDLQQALDIAVNAATDSTLIAKHPEVPDVLEHYKQALEGSLKTLKYSGNEVLIKETLSTINTLEHALLVYK